MALYLLLLFQVVLVAVAGATNHLRGANKGSVIPFEYPLFKQVTVIKLDNPANFMPIFYFVYFRVVSVIRRGEMILWAQKLFAK